jgi:hypothetical protein
MTTYRIKVKYINNPAGPLSGYEVVQSAEPPAYGSWGMGVWGRYRNVSKRPKVIKPEVEASTGQIGTNSISTISRYERRIIFLQRRAIDDRQEIAELRTEIAKLRAGLSLLESEKQEAG